MIDRAKGMHAEYKSSKAPKSIANKAPKRER